MSVQKSTIDRFAVARRPSTVFTPQVTTPTADAALPATGLPVSPGLRRLFTQLERRSPALGGLLAERLWFRLPAGPAAAARAARTPAGGEAFTVDWTRGSVHGTVRGRV